MIARREDGRSVRVHDRAPAELARYIAAKGSICVDGVSLTVNAVEGAEFELNIVPHTLAETTWATSRPGGASTWKWIWSRAIWSGCYWARPRSRTPAAASPARLLRACGFLRV